MSFVGSSYDKSLGTIVNRGAYPISKILCLYREELDDLLQWCIHQRRVDLGNESSIIMSCSKCQNFLRVARKELSSAKRSICMSNDHPSVLLTRV